jgi:hypothetical protein
MQYINFERKIFRQDSLRVIVELKFSESSALAFISEFCDDETCCSRAINYAIIQFDLETRLIYESSAGSCSVHDVQTNSDCRGYGEQASGTNTFSPEKDEATY